MFCLKNRIENSIYLPFMPAPRWITELKAELKSFHTGIRNGYMKIELDHTFAQDHIFSAYNTETKTTGYILLNAGMGTEIHSRKGRHLFSISFSGNNLTDEAYQNHLSRLKYADTNLATGRVGVFNMGRNFACKLNIPLSFELKSKH